MNICFLHEYFEEQADLTPDAPALINEKEQFTYKEVENISNQIALFLRSKGIQTGDMVGIYFGRGKLPILSMLGILKAGAGYVPIDPVYPEDRMTHIIADANIRVILTENLLAPNIQSIFKGTILPLDELLNTIDKLPINRIKPSDIGLQDNNLSYIMYTSGSTGKPKGVMTEHRNIVSFVKSFKKVCALTREDRIYQGFSFGFDGSVEEMWMCYANGASLIVGNDEIAKLGAETAQYLTDKKVTYFSTVPTFLTMIKTDLPTVKLLVVSGEACPQELVNKWAVNGRRMLNVYGPTETTVNTTAADCKAGKEVTIGKPLDGYDTFILDQNMQPVHSGSQGELYIGGPGLSRGYMNLKEVTEKAFIPTPSHIKTSSSRIYKTGDLVSLNQDGEYNFYGRIDLQVKIRGYRIELTEIEAVLREYSGVTASAVTAYNHDSITELASYIVITKGSSVDRNEMLGLLKKKLPSYMIPSYLDEIDAMPLLSSGKTDRKKLPLPKTTLIKSKKNIVEPVTPTETALVEIWKELFKTEAVSTDDDFFMDLGGYSLIAAQSVSLIRQKLKNEIAIRDTYRFTTIQKLADYCDSLKVINSSDEVSDSFSTINNITREPFYKISLFKRWICTFFQALSLGALFGAGAGLVLLSIILYNGIRQDSISINTFIMLSVTLFFSSFPAALLFSIFSKWIIIGKFKPGKYPLWGSYYFRWWLVTRIQRISGAAFLAGTPFMNIYCRLMGAKIGKDVILNTSFCSIYDLLTIGNTTSVGFESQLLGYRVENGILTIGSISIGDRCFVGIQSALGVNSSMGNDCSLDDLSLLPDNSFLQEGESKAGSPAQVSVVALPQKHQCTKVPMNIILFGFLNLISLYTLELFLVVTALPSMALLYLAFQKHDWLWWIGLLSAAVILFEFTFWIGLILFKKIILGPTKPGTYQIRSLDYLRKWLIDSLLNLSKLLTLPLYTTLYILPLLRMLGLKIGTRAELSVIAYLSPDLVEIGDESFFADGSIIGGLRLHDGLCQIETNKIGKRSFVGNSAVLPTGKHLGNNCLIGVISTPPSNTLTTPDTTEWLGTPAFELPNRKKVEGFNNEVTFNPSRALIFSRLLIDSLRIIIPSSIEIASVIGLIVLTNTVYKNNSWPVILASLPLIGTVIACGMVFCAILVKNIIMGVYKPVVKPLWSPYVWLNEVVNGVYESVAAPMLTLFAGTPFLPFFLRLFGTKIGKRVFMETTLLGEFDLVEIGDDAALNFDAIVQNHLFEDRIFKSSYLKIGNECSIGNMAVVLYDTEMQPGSSIGSLSLLMKGENVPSRSRWEGIPIKAQHSEKELCNAND
jgi:non-ribosomal peptide synthetase-like protein